MAIPLRKHPTDARTPAAPPRFGAVWGAEGTSVADARNAVRGLLARAGHHRDHRISQDAEIVVSELVTNALRHAPGPGGLFLEMPAPDRLRITVRDSSPQAPAPRLPDPRRVGGHGLLLITRLCEQVRTIAHEGGKQVMAELGLPPAPGGRRPQPAW
ncbi:ATP-binding protein [Streptomyces sp. AHA2]|uniref:ATP-binding protein n=1 Tax=Streptomyces sp. AHA2 TaxID=3064526 RepID=UPI002FE29027